MFDQILQLVREHLNNNPQLAGNIPPEQADDVHREIATHITNGLQNQAAAPVTAGGILSELESSLASGNLATSAITGGLVGSLAGKFGLPPAITGAIAAALPGLMQKFTQKNSTEKV
jgi:hypothetical protein